MRMKMVCDDRTLREVANEFLALKKAQKVRERTLSDYKKYIDKFLAQSQNTLDVDVLKIEILEYFADIPKTSPARFNHPYQYLHALFEWCAKQDYLPYNPFQKLQLKKVRDEGNVQPAEIKDIQTLLKALDKHNYTELRDYNIIMLILDTGIRTSELMSIKNEDYDPEAMSIVIRPDVAKTSRSRTLYLSAMTNTCMDDKSIVDLYFNRNEEAITQTDKKYGRYCYSIAYNILNNKEDAEESVSDTYMTAWRSIPPRCPSVLSTFLGKITRHISIDRWRERSATKRGGGEVPLALEELKDCISGMQDVEMEYERKEVLKTYAKFLEALPTTERRVFLCRYWYVESIETIADKFGFSQSKVKTMLHRTRVNLRKQFAKEGF